MRAAVLPSALGVCLMLAAADPTPADGQELKPPYTQFVKVSGTDGKGKAFAVDGIPAYIPDTKAPIWRLQARRMEAAVTRPFSGVVITDKDGNAHKIKEIKNGPGPYLTCIIDQPAKN